MPQTDRTVEMGRSSAEEFRQMFG